MSTPEPQDAFAHWGEMSNSPKAEAGASSSEIHQAWLASPAQWRSFDAERLEVELLQRVASLRSAKARRPLALDQAVSEAARVHSVERVVSLTTPTTAQLHLEQAGVSTEWSVIREGQIDLLPMGVLRLPEGPYPWATLIDNIIEAWAGDAEFMARLMTRKAPVLGVGVALLSQEDPPSIQLTAILCDPD